MSTIRDLNTDLGLASTGDLTGLTTALAGGGVLPKAGDRAFG
jgi:hypothetical protein